MHLFVYLVWQNRAGFGHQKAVNILICSIFISVSKITLLSSLECSFRISWKPLPLLVKIIHKSRLRYYGKFGLKIDYPYQVSLNLASQTSTFQRSSVHAFISVLGCISGLLRSRWPEWHNVACALERTLSRVLPETQRWHSVVPPKLHLEAELPKPLTTTNGPSQNEELWLCRYVQTLTLCHSFTFEKWENLGNIIT